MTIDANGRAHRAPGSPASTGGQYAEQPSPAAASTLTAPAHAETLDWDLSSELALGHGAYLSSSGGYPFDAAEDAFDTLSSADNGYQSISLSAEGADFKVDSEWPAALDGQFEAFDHEEGWEETHGEQLDALIETTGVGITRHDDGTFDLHASVVASGTPTFRAANDALMASAEADTLRRLVSERGGLDDRLARFEATGQSTLDEDEWGAFVHQYVTSALWSTTNHRAMPDSDDYDENASEMLDGDHDVDSLTSEAREKLAKDAAEWMAANLRDVELVLERDDYDETNLAHDLWLTSNGHGAGFWDRGLGELGDRLTASSKSLGEENLWADADGRVHAGY